MDYETIDPQEAARRLQADPGHVYLDVRTEEEYRAGHAPGALNVPIAFMGPGGMQANPDFVKVVAAAVPKDAKLLVGCKMGGRSMRACEVLADEGFVALANVDGGFSGRPDARSESARKGWQGSGLPVETAPTPGGDYASLRAKAAGS